MRKKISIIGAGNVGATIAFTLASHGIASEIVLIDINKNKARGEAMDILQGLVMNTPIDIYAGEYECVKDSDIVIVTMGLARKPGQTRLDLAQQNVNITKDVMANIIKYAPDALYVVVSNPVDIITYTLIKACGIPAERVIGTGTLLDTARLRSIIADRVNLSGRNVHAYVFGEHGDTSVIPWSITSIAGIDLVTFIKEDKDIPNQYLEQLQLIEKDVRTSGAKIIEYKGATFYAISFAVKTLCESIKMDNNSILTVSTMLSGQYGIEDVCLSIPTVIGAKGVLRYITPALSEEEHKALMHSAESLKKVIKELDI